MFCKVEITLFIACHSCNETSMTSVVFIWTPHSFSAGSQNCVLVVTAFLSRSLKLQNYFFLAQYNPSSYYLRTDSSTTVIFVFAVWAEIWRRTITFIWGKTSSTGQRHRRSSEEKQKFQYRRNICNQLYTVLEL